MLFDMVLPPDSRGCAELYASPCARPLLAKYGDSAWPRDCAQPLNLAPDLPLYGQKNRATLRKFARWFLAVAHQYLQRFLIVTLLFDRLPPNRQVGRSNFAGRAAARKAERVRPATGLTPLRLFRTPTAKPTEERGRSRVRISIGSGAMSAEGGGAASSCRGISTPRIGGMDSQQMTRKTKKKRDQPPPPEILRKGGPHKDRTKYDRKRRHEVPDQD